MMAPTIITGKAIKATVPSIPIFKISNPKTTPKKATVTFLIILLTVSLIKQQCANTPFFIKLMIVNLILILMTH